MPQPAELFPQPEKTAGDPEAVWKKELAKATRSDASLLEQLWLAQHIELTDSQADFRCLVTDSYLKKMQPGNIDDPLLLQVLPLNKETYIAAQNDGMTDPVGDLEALVSPGLLHKYHGRVLLISTGACAIHCRYCFRRSYPYQQFSYTNNTLDGVLGYLNRHNEVEEVILSGGDPLVLDNEKLNHLISRLESISHLQTLRIHTRLPVVLPKRIDKGLLELLKSSRFQIVMVIHSNHANELLNDEYTKLLQLHHAGITLLNQSVLLRGINDDAETLIALSKRLFQCKTLPYYLHLLDPVKGAMHFDVDKKEALKIKHRIEAQLPGYLVPRLVKEIAGKEEKTEIFRI